MRKLIRKASRGFTLIELMIVVAIIGILAVLAIYGVRKYIANAKTAEARNSLGQMGKDESTAFEKESMAGAVLAVGTSALASRSLCLNPTASIPTTIAGVTGKKYQSNPTEWTVDQNVIGKGFACLKFEMDAPQYYMYNFVTANPTIATGTWTATANGDLDGNGTQSTFTLKGAITANMTFDLAPNLIELNPEE